MSQVVLIGGILYVLWESLGAGQFGEVFRATEATDPNVLWAVKKLFAGVEHPEYRTPREAGDREFVQQLMVAVMNRRFHPNVVSVRFGQQVGDDYYIVMEYCEGSLVNLFAYGHHGEEWILPVARDLLTGLAFIHDLGALHNDLHSKNVLFARDLQRRPGPWKDPAFFPLHGPGLFTFKITDFGFGGHWFRSESDERPELIVGDIRMAAQVLADVAVGRHESFLDPPAIDRIPARYAEPIRRALAGGFEGEGAALNFLEAMRGDEIRAPR